MISLTEKERAYIAGVLDSRGSVIVPPTPNGSTRNICIRVSIHKKRKDLLSYLHSTLGGCLSNYSDNRAFWQLGSLDSLELLKLISPYFKTKRRKKQSRLIIENYKDLRRGSRAANKVGVRGRKSLVRKLQAA